MVRGARFSYAELVGSLRPQNLSPHLVDLAHNVLDDVIAALEPLARLHR